MTTWNCTACTAARAVGVVDCPQCGTKRAPFRENGEGPIFDLVETSEPRFDGDREALGVQVRDSTDSGTTQVPERTENDHA